MFDKRAVEKTQVVFHDVAAIEVKPHVKKNSVAMELADFFSVFYSQDSTANSEATLKDKASKIVVEKGQIVKVSRDKTGIVSREALRCGQLNQEAFQMAEPAQSRDQL